MSEDAYDCLPVRSVQLGADAPLFPQIEKRLVERIGQACGRAGLSQRQMVIMLAKILGTMIAKGPVEEHAAQLEVCTRAMNTAYTVRTYNLTSGREPFNDTRRDPPDPVGSA